MGSSAGCPHGAIVLFDDTDDRIHFEVGVFEIVGGCSEDLGIVTEVTKSKVALWAQQATYTFTTRSASYWTAFVIVINLDCARRLKVKTITTRRTTRLLVD